MKVVVDIYGGDNAPNAIIDGVVLALNSYSGFEVVAVGKQEVINSLLFKHSVDMTRINIIDAQDVITNEDVPTVAIRSKKESSLVVALDKLKNDNDCVGLVSAGSTGAVLTGAFLKIGRINGISRPALAPLLPTLKGGKVLLLDCGANVDCKPEMLAQFAVMGSAYMQAVQGCLNPRVALLSNGTEDKKGNELTKAAFQLIKQLPINFIGNMEARDMLSGEFDVIVADGFSGNIALKTCEGTAGMLLKVLKNEVTSSFKRKLGAALLRGAFSSVKKTMDYNNSGGAPFIGASKLIIKSHGSSKAQSICGSIMQVVNMHNSKLIEKITANLIQYNITGEADA